MSDLTVAKKDAPTKDFIEAGAKWNGQKDHSVPHAYDKKAAASKAYSSKPQQREVNEAAELRLPGAVQGGDLIDGKPDPTKRAPIDIDVTVKAMALVDADLCDKYVPLVKVAGQDAGTVDTIKKAFDTECADKNKVKVVIEPEVANNTWKNVLFAAKAERGGEQEPPDA